MQDPAGTTPAPGAQPPRRDTNSIMGGVVLITLGVLFLLANLVPGLDFSDLWPVLLLVIGGGLLWKSRRTA